MLDGVIELGVRGRGETLRAIAALLDALTTIDVAQVDALPPILESGVRYRFDGRRDACGLPRGRWCDARTVERQRHGDCKSLAPWWAAQARRRGDFGACAVPFYVTPSLVHVVGVAGDGRVVDPSIALGMPIPQGLTARDFVPNVAGSLIAIGRPLVRTLAPHPLEVLTWR